MFIFYLNVTIYILYSIIRNIFIFISGELYAKLEPSNIDEFVEGLCFTPSNDFGQTMPMLGNCIDIFGDGSFWAFSTPGHTKGHTSYIINRKEMQAVITGDACASQKGFDLDIETGRYSLNVKEGRESFIKIK